jgi:hypothetical protein
MVHMHQNLKAVRSIEELLKSEKYYDSLRIGRWNMADHIRTVEGVKWRSPKITPRS